MRGLVGHPVAHRRRHRRGLWFLHRHARPAIADFGTMLLRKSTDGVTANSYLRMMSHTAAVNIGVFFGLTGRLVTTSSACTSASQGIGYAFEMIRSGRQKVMLAGGAEELDVTEAAVFDVLFATSVRYNERPELTPRPFDVDRDGLVVGEGACTLVLEELEFALARGAPILAEVIGFGTNSDGAHVTQPNSATMARAMQLALDDAGLAPRGRRLRERARHRDAAWRCGRKPCHRAGVRQPRADQLAEELHGAHHGCLRFAGSVDQHPHDARGLVRAHPEPHAGGSALRELDYIKGMGREAAARTSSCPTISPSAASIPRWFSGAGRHSTGAGGLAEMPAAKFQRTMRALRIALPPGHRGGSP